MVIFPSWLKDYSPETVTCLLRYMYFFPHRLSYHGFPASGLIYIYTYRVRRHVKGNQQNRKSLKLKSSRVCCVRKIKIKIKTK